MMGWECVEYCPHCDSEATYPDYNPDKQGYKVRCTECGEQIMLCTECFHAPDNKEHYCDWHVSRESEHYQIGKCFRGWNINRK